MNEPGVSHFGAVEIQRIQACQPLKMLQSCVSHFGGLELQIDADGTLRIEGNFTTQFFDRRNSSSL